VTRDNGKLKKGQTNVSGELDGVGKIDPTHPPLTTLVKLGSIAVHADEGCSDDGHPFDVLTIKHLLADPEVKEWMAAMDKLAFLPKKRNDRS
jgi:hypothetical protein